MHADAARATQETGATQTMGATSRAKTPERWVLGGRTFLPIENITVQQEFTANSLISRINLTPMREVESYDSYARRLMDSLSESAAVLAVIGCLFVPEDAVQPGQDPGQAWTPAIARQTADFVAHLTDPADRASVRAYAVGMAKGFFQHEIASPEISLSSSRRGKRWGRRPRASTGSGPTSLWSSLKAIMTVPSTSRPGRSAPSSRRA